jgi:hypothetical protein
MKFLDDFMFGAAKALDLFGVLQKPRRFKHAPRKLHDSYEDDYKVLKKDWEEIGRDFTRIIRWEKKK